MQTDGDATPARRPLSRGPPAGPRALTRLLLKTPVTPNQVSRDRRRLCRGGRGGDAARARASPWLWLAGALVIQLRLLANLLDGLVAVEGGRGSATGALYNELPDRIEDTPAAGRRGLCRGLGLARLAGARCWRSACAYVRAVGASLGLRQDFSRADGQAAPDGGADPRRACSASRGARREAGLGDVLGAGADRRWARPVTFVRRLAASPARALREGAGA